MFTYILGLLLVDRSALQQIKRSFPGKESRLNKIWLEKTERDIEIMIEKIDIKEIQEVLAVPFKEWRRVSK